MLEVVQSLHHWLEKNDLPTEGVTLRIVLPDGKSEAARLADAGNGDLLMGIKVEFVDEKKPGPPLRAFGHRSPD